MEVVKERKVQPRTVKEAVAEIRAGLKRRSDRAWSVTHGRGSAYGWITVMSPPARRDGGHYVSDEDAELLCLLFDLPYVHPQGFQIPAGSDYYQEWIDRANGREPTLYGTPYWD